MKSSIKDGDSKEAIESAIYDETNYFEYLIQDINSREKYTYIKHIYSKEKG